MGVLVWSWIGYMNPHRLTWGFAYDFPLAMVVGTGDDRCLAVLARTQDPTVASAGPAAGCVFAAWVSFTTLFAAYPDHAQAKWDRTIKILLFNGFVTLGLITTRRRLDALIWVIVLSLGFLRAEGRGVHCAHGRHVSAGRDRRRASSATTTRSAWRF